MEKAAEDIFVLSESDERIINNNLMRHAYRVLNDHEKEQMRLIKDYGLNFVAALHSVGRTDPGQDKQGSRELAIAATKIEEAVMWAVKHITK